jgi:hypothetical protein
MSTLLAKAVAAIEEAPDVWIPDADANVQTRVIRVMAAIGAIGKDSEMKEGPAKYQYRGIDAILNRANPAMARFGLFIAPTVQDVEYEERRAGKEGRTVMVVCHLTVEFNVHGLAGDRLEPPLVLVGEAFDTSDKATNKAQTAAFKLALGQLFAIPYSEPDQDSERHELGEAPEPVDPPSPEEEQAKADLLELLDHAPDELVDGWTAKYHRDVWQGAARSWGECPPKWAPVILRGARKRLEEWEAEQAAAPANGSMVPSQAMGHIEDSPDPTLPLICEDCGDEYQARDPHVCPTVADEDPPDDPDFDQ